MATKKETKKIYSIYLTERDNERLGQLAAANYRSRSQQIKFMVEEALKRAEKEKKE